MLRVNRRECSASFCRCKNLPVQIFASTDSRELYSKDSVDLVLPAIASCHLIKAISSQNTKRIEKHKNKIASWVFSHCAECQSEMVIKRLGKEITPWPI